MITEQTPILNRSSLKLSSIICRPNAPHSSPAVVILHGFTGFKTEPHISRFAGDLTSAGYVSVRFDASGFGESDGEPSSDFRISSYLTDIFDVLSFLKTLAYVRSDQIGLSGHSLGASLAIVAAGTSNEFMGCCSVQPCTKLPRPTWTRDIIQWKKQGFMDLESECPQHPSFRLPWQFVEDADRIDARDFVSKIECPLEIMYGTVDTTVVPSDTISIFELAPPQAKLTALPDVGHFFWEFPEQLTDISSKVVSFFESCFTAV